MIKRFVSILLILATGTLADRLTLKNGGVLEGKVSRQDQQIILEVDGGKFSFRESDIVSIEQAVLPAEEFAGRLKAATGNASACLELAQWAWQKNLKEQYVTALRAVLLADPQHAQARKMMREYRSFYQKIPVNDSAEARFQRDLGPGFQLCRTAHYLIGYNTSEVFAQAAGERLEKLHDWFMRFFAERGFEPMPLAERLEIALFNTEADFLSHTRQLLPNLAGSAGFFYSKTGRGYFYDSIASDNEQIRQNVQKLQASKKQIADFRQTVQGQGQSDTRFVFEDEKGKRTLDQNGALKELDEQEQRIEQEYQRLRLYYYNQNAAVTVHEGVHQLAWFGGIQSRYFTTPKWLSEGLAVYFESPREGDWRQPGELHGDRLKTFLSRDAAAGRFSLAQLICRDDLFDPARHEVADEAYASAWALFYYLVQKHHERLFDYLFELAAKIESGDKGYPEQERLDDFERFFGKIEPFEKMWRADMALRQEK